MKNLNELITRFRSQSDMDVRRVITNSHEFTQDAIEAAKVVLNERGINLPQERLPTINDERIEMIPPRPHLWWKMAIAAAIAWVICWFEIFGNLMADRYRTRPFHQIDVVTAESFGMLVGNSILTFGVTWVVARIYWKLNKPECLSKKRCYTFLIVPVTILLQIGRQAS